MRNGLGFLTTENTERHGRGGCGGSSSARAGGIVRKKVAVVSGQLSVAGWCGGRLLSGGYAGATNRGGA